MSAEIYGSNPKNARLVGEIGVEVARLLTETGVSHADAHTVGVKAAEYGAWLLLSTQEMLGEVLEGNCGDEDFIQQMRMVGCLTTNPELENELFPE